MRSLPALVLVTALGAACGHEIGDECSISADCSPQGDRVCDVSANGSPGGYCTIIGCDYDTCPDEAVCVRFFPFSNPDLTCDPQTEDLSTDACRPDELCTLQNVCAARSSELRYCMRRCSGSGDCRDRYECRDAELMRLHGGEPVPRPGEPVASELTGFCAAAP